MPDLDAAADRERAATFAFAGIGARVAFDQAIACANTVAEAAHIRMQLDRLTKDTGCLRVIPGSHLIGDQYANTLQSQIRKSDLSIVRALRQLGKLTRDTLMQRE